MRCRPHLPIQQQIVDANQMRIASLQEQRARKNIPRICAPSATIRATRQDYSASAENLNDSKVSPELEG